MEVLLRQLQHNRWEAASYMDIVYVPAAVHVYTHKRAIISVMLALALHALCNFHAKLRINCECAHIATAKGLL